MANRLADARRSLNRAKEAAQRRLKEIESEQKELKASLKSLDAAIRALGTPKPSTPKPVTGDDEHRQASGSNDVVSE